MEILVYADPSSRGEWALAAGKLLVPAVADEVTLLATEEDARAHPRLLAAAQEALRVPGVALRAVTRPGPAEKAVLEESRARPYGIVVVPPAGRRAIARLIRGSRVATVVRQVRSTVLVARRPPPQVRRILVAVSGGVHSPFTTMCALELARALGASVSVLHVQSGVELPPNLPLVEKRAPAATMVARGKQFEQIDLVKKALANAGLEPEVHLREGFVVDEILADVEERAADLLVIGAHRPEGATRAHDDVTERILLGCPIPILVVRAPHPAGR